MLLIQQAKLGKETWVCLTIDKLDTLPKVEHKEFCTKIITQFYNNQELLCVSYEAKTQTYNKDNQTESLNHFRKVSI